MPHHANEPIGIIAGTGLLPQMLVEACEAQGRGVCIVTFEGMALDWFGDRAVIRARFERPGEMFGALKAAGCKSVVFAGAITRPRFDPALFDAKFHEIAEVFLAAIGDGDDATLRAIAGIFEDEGFALVAAHQILPDLMLSGSVYSARQPDDIDKKDAARACDIVQALGAVDVGQGAVVSRGICLATESIQGTDAMLQFVADTRKDFIQSAGESGGVLFKGAKPGQDMRFDVPAIGVRTIEMAARAGLSGVVVEAGNVMLLDRAGAIDAANRLGIFLWAR